MKKIFVLLAASFLLNGLYAQDEETTAEDPEATSEETGTESESPEEDQGSSSDDGVTVEGDQEGTDTEAEENYQGNGTNQESSDDGTFSYFQHSHVLVYNCLLAFTEGYRLGYADSIHGRGSDNGSTVYMGRELQYFQRGYDTGVSDQGSSLVPYPRIPKEIAHYVMQNKDFPSRETIIRDNRLDESFILKAMPQTEDYLPLPRSTSILGSDSRRGVVFR